MTKKHKESTEIKILKENQKELPNPRKAWKVYKREGL